MTKYFTLFAVAAAAAAVIAGVTSPAEAWPTTTSGCSVWLCWGPLG